MTADEIRKMMDNVAAAKSQGQSEPGDELRLTAMMIAEIAAQLAELNQNLRLIFFGNLASGAKLRVDVLE